MVTDIQMKQANAAFKTLCAMLDENGWNYRKNEEELYILCGAQGDDLPMPIRISVEADRMLVILVSPMTFDIPEDKRDALAVAVGIANCMIADGSFDYNRDRGQLAFRMTSSYMDSLLGKELFRYILYVSCQTIDEFNDKFYELTRRDMSFDEIVKFVGTVKEA